MRSSLRTLTTVDIVTIVFINALSLLAVIFSARIPVWWHIVIGNILFSMIIFFSAVRGPDTGYLRLIHDWYPVPLILYVFKLTYAMVHPIQPVDYDWLFISIDRSIFGQDPTHWLMQYSHPILTEILQLCYSSYYFIFLVVAYQLYRREDKIPYYYGIFLVVYGFFLSYIGYFVLPGVGPRFTLHDFASLNTELPGLFFTYWIREFLNAGESIPAGVQNAVDYVQRDIFPSGHTQLTLVALFIAFKQKISSRWILLIIGSILIIATVYLRYHYVVDVIAGIAFFFFTLWSGKGIDAWWKRKIV
jgi:membrane-associated phospholipid phosphatase